MIFTSLRVYIQVHLLNTYHEKNGGFTDFEALQRRWRAISSKTADEWVNFVEGQRGKFLQGFDAEGEPEDLRARLRRKLYTNHTREARKLHK